MNGLLRGRDGRPGRWDHAVALLLAAIYFLSLLATLDIGYTRDEGYYFRYAQVYQDWFTDVAQDLSEEGPNPSLDRQEVVRAWSQNFEHPPLMKTLFGWSWRLFGRKLRPVAAVRQDGSLWSAEIRQVRKSEGFPEGAEVSLLPPQRVGEGEPPPMPFHGVVTSRRGSAAKISLTNTEGADLAAFAAACDGAERASRDTLRGCVAVERGTLAWLSEGSALRLPALVFASFVIWLLYLFGVRLVGRWAALFAVGVYAALPRGFFHAHLACFDVPVVATTLLVLYAFWRAQWSRRWAVLTGVAWGFALLTKHNAFFLPVFLGLYWLVAGRDRISLRGWRLRLPPLPLAFLWMPLIGLPMLFVLWPKLWFDPARALGDYFSFHLHHEHYMQYYFGAVLEVPPFPVSLPFVLTLLTVPVLSLAAFLVGSARVCGSPLRARLAALSQRSGGTPLDEEARYGRRLRAFLGLNLLLPIILIALPNTPIFGGVKHWLAAMPFFALLAGVGFDGLRGWLSRTLVPRSRALAGALGAALLAVLLLPSVVETARIHPFGTAYYNTLIGGVQGAAEARMHRQFWGYATRQTFERLNREAPPRARVYFQNTTHDAYVLYKRDGLLRQDIRHTGGPADADVALFEHQKSFAEIERDLWTNMGVRGPAWQVTAEGVPMISVYVRERAIGPPAR